MMSPPRDAAAPAHPVVDLDDKLRRLRDSASYGPGAGAVEAVETHMSWVFLVGDLAYKLKKPVRFAFLDFSTLAAREADCRAELRLNRRLAPDVYLRLATLNASPDGGLALDGAGAIVDWLVVMRRLPAERMLDRLLAEGAVAATDIDRLGVVLADFYRAAARPAVAPGEYRRRLEAELGVNRDVLTRRRFAVDHGRVPELLTRMEAALRDGGALLEARAAQGRLVDGHGDLRPEHVCLAGRIAIFDCLEFSDALRTVDPVDELAYLGVESALLGAHWLGPKLFVGVMRDLGEPPPWALFHLHTARRAFLRARLALAHLLDAQPRLPHKWEPLATRYLALASQALDAWDGCADQRG